MNYLPTKVLRYEPLIGFAPPLPPPQDLSQCNTAPLSKSGVRLRIPASGLPRSGRIFVQIAPYRETDLANSLRDLFSKAADPVRLRVGICWQHTEDESLEEFA